MDILYFRYSRKKQENNGVGDISVGKKQNRYHRLLLTDAIKDKNSRIVNLSKQCSVLRNELFNGTTWMKAQFIIFSINRLLKSEMTKVKTRHNKKMDNLLSLKQAIVLMDCKRTLMS